MPGPGGGSPRVVILITRQADAALFHERNAAPGRNPLKMVGASGSYGRTYIGVEVPDL
jgi:hypothetical protein